MAAANSFALHLVRQPISFMALLLLFLIILTHNTSPLLVLAKNFTVGETLSTSDPPMQSPSGDFSFGFHPLPHPNNGSDDQTYLLSIWYTKIPETTIVWYGYQDGNLAPKGSTLALTSTDGLVLKNPNGQVIWKPPILNGAVVDHCFLSNAGNLIASNDAYQSLWESFMHPRDTLLPTQKITVDREGENPILYSRREENDFRRGRFMMRLQDGFFQLVTRNPTYYGVPSKQSAIYWSSGVTLDPGLN